MHLKKFIENKTINDNRLMIRVSVALITSTLLFVFILQPTIKNFLNKKRTITTIKRNASLIEKNKQLLAIKNMELRTLKKSNPKVFKESLKHHKTYTTMNNISKEITGVNLKVQEISPQNSNQFHVEISGSYQNLLNLIENWQTGTEPIDIKKATLARNNYDLTLAIQYE